MVAIPCDLTKCGVSPSILVLEIIPIGGGSEALMESRVKGRANVLVGQIHIGDGRGEMKHVRGGCVHLVSHLCGGVVSVNIENFGLREVFALLDKILVSFDVMALEMG